MTDRVERVAVVGTGLIGASWAALFLARGFEVRAYDPAPGAEARLRDRVESAWPSLERIGLTEDASRYRLDFTASIAQAVAGAAFVQESGPERIDLKRAVIAEIERAVGADVVIATSSSGLRISDVQAGARHPERIVLGHPFNPPHIIPLVEVIGGERTSEETIRTAMDFYASLGKKPVRISREVPGHVANRLQVAVWREAIGLVRSGVVSVADLDTVMAEGPGLRWALLGPFANLQAGGGAGGIRHMLEHLGPAMREWSADLAEFPADDDYIDEIAGAVDADLDLAGFADTVRRRDELLLELLAAKSH